MDEEANCPLCRAVVKHPCSTEQFVKIISKVTRAVAIFFQTAIAVLSAAAATALLCKIGVYPEIYTDTESHGGVLTLVTLFGLQVGAPVANIAISTDRVKDLILSLSTSLYNWQHGMDFSKEDLDFRRAGLSEKDMAEVIREMAYNIILHMLEDPTVPVAGNPATTITKESLEALFRSFCEEHPDAIPTLCNHALKSAPSNQIFEDWIAYLLNNEVLQSSDIG